MCTMTNHRRLRNVLIHKIDLLHDAWLEPHSEAEHIQRLEELKKLVKTLDLLEHLTYID